MTDRERLLEQLRTITRCRLILEVDAGAARTRVEPHAYGELVRWSDLARILENPCSN